MLVSWQNNSNTELAGRWGQTVKMLYRNNYNTSNHTQYNNEAVSGRLQQMRCDNSLCEWVFRTSPPMHALVYIQQTEIEERLNAMAEEK